MKKKKDLNKFSAAEKAIIISAIITTVGQIFIASMNLIPTLLDIKKKKGLIHIILVSQHKI